MNGGHQGWEGVRRPVLPLPKGPIYESPGNSLPPTFWASVCHRGDKAASQSLGSSFWDRARSPGGSSGWSEEDLNIPIPRIHGLQPPPTPLRLDQQEVRTTGLWACLAPELTHWVKGGHRRRQSWAGMGQGWGRVAYLSIMALKSNTPSMSLAANLQGLVRDVKLYRHQGRP